MVGFSEPHLSAQLAPSSLPAGDPGPVRGDVLPGGVPPAGVDALGHRPQPPPRLRQQLRKLPHLHARRGEVQVRKPRAKPFKNDVRTEGEGR